MWRTTHLWRRVHVPRALRECGRFLDPSHGPLDAAAQRGEWTWRRHDDPDSPGATLRARIANTYGTSARFPDVRATDGGSVTVTRLGLMDLAGIVREDCLDTLQLFQVSLLEDTLQASRAQSNRAGRLIRAHSIVDLDRLSVFTALRYIRRVAPPVLHVAQAFYPEINASSTAINAPLGVESLWKIIALLLDDVMRRKVLIVGRSYAKAIRTHALVADVTQLPASLGGTRSDAGLPKCPPIPKGIKAALAADPGPKFMQHVEGTPRARNLSFS